MRWHNAYVFCQKVLPGSTSHRHQNETDILTVTRDKIKENNMIETVERFAAPGRLRYKICNYKSYMHSQNEKLGQKNAQSD